MDKRKFYFHRNTFKQPLAYQYFCLSHYSFDLSMKRIAEKVQFHISKILQLDHNSYQYAQPLSRAVDIYSVHTTYTKGLNWAVHSVGSSIFVGITALATHTFMAWKTHLLDKLSQAEQTNLKYNRFSFTLLNVSGNQTTTRSICVSPKW